MEVIDSTLKNNLVNLRRLLTEKEKHVDVNYKPGDDGRAALHFAALTGHAECLDLLLRQPSIQVDLQDSKGNTALHIASAFGNTICAKILLSAGANVHLANEEGLKPVDVATEDIVDLLIERMAIPHTPGVLKQYQEAAKIRDDLPNDLASLKVLLVDLLISNQKFEDRCKETIHQLIEQKHIALHKNRLLELAAGVKDKNSATKFIDQLQYLSDENEKLETIVSNSKNKIRLLEIELQTREESYRRQMEELKEQHTLQVKAVLRRQEESEKVFLEYQRRVSAVDGRMKEEFVASPHRRKSSVEPGSINRPHTIIERKELPGPDKAHLEMKIKELEAQNLTLQERLKTTENLKSVVEKEVDELRKNIGGIRQSLHDQMIRQLEAVPDEQNDKDVLDGKVVFVNVEGRSRIKAATPEKLVERLLAPSTFDNQMIPAFFLTFRSFMTCKSVMQVIISVYKQSIMNEVKTEDEKSLIGKLHMRISDALQHWIENYWNDFINDMELLQTLKNFIENDVREQDKPLITPALKGAIHNKEFGDTTPKSSPRLTPKSKPKPILPRYLKRSNTNNLSIPLFSPNSSESDLSAISASFNGASPISPNPAPQQSQLSKTNWISALAGNRKDEDIKIKIADLDPLELARQITLIEFDLFRNLKPFEFLDQAWMKEDKTVKAPNILKMSAWSNHVVHWVVSEIVQNKDTKSRAALFEKFIQVAYQLEKMNNFNGEKEVLAGLQSSSLYRLKKTKGLVSSKSMKLFEELNKNTSSELNYKNLRAKVQNADPPLIPFPGVYQSDLVFLDGCSKDKLDGGLVNFQKFQKVAGYILELQSYQRTSYIFEPVIELQDYIREYKILDEETAYNYSLSCEPRA
ncbi:ras guanine nucleotide exchange factor domain-containing protein [Paraphysoderma sedebokerense]|nr:ras guanine nucleotide exchange factor domain-containing protein [Paraphysoderma sedebokerense]